MPNWCYNTLHIRGNKEILDEFKAKTILRNVQNDYDQNGDKFTFNILKPLPKALEGEYSPLRKLEGETDEEYKGRMAENMRLYGAEDWYYWHIKNWGTKWDACHSRIENDEDTYLQVYFDTAWSPPLDWFDTIIPMFPQLEFECYISEESEAFALYLYAKDGENEMREGDYTHYDENGLEVYYKEGNWYYKKGDTKVEEEDFWPSSEPVFN